MITLINSANWKKGWNLERWKGQYNNEFNDYLTKTQAHQIIGNNENSHVDEKTCTCDAFNLYRIIWKESLEFIAV